MYINSSIIVLIASYSLTDVITKTAEFTITNNISEYFIITIRNIDCLFPRHYIKTHRGETDYLFVYFLKKNVIAQLKCKNTKSGEHGKINGSGECDGDVE